VKFNRQSEEFEINENDQQMQETAQFNNSKKMSAKPFETVESQNDDTSNNTTYTS
jgi:hypothetical protein